MKLRTSVTKTYRAIDLNNEPPPDEIVPHLVMSAIKTLAEGLFAPGFRPYFTRGHTYEFTLSVKERSDTT